MSMNLNCNLVELWQTPTSITYMCLETDQGFLNEVKGKQAKAALARYIHWIKGSANGIYKSPKEADTARKYINDHIEEVNKVIKNKKLKVYMQ